LAQEEEVAVAREVLLELSVAQGQEQAEVQWPVEFIQQALCPALLQSLLGQEGMAVQQVPQAEKVQQVF